MQDALESEFHSLFTEQELETCKKKLRDCGYQH